MAHHSFVRALPVAVAVFAIAAPAVVGATAFVNFESGQVRPLALSPNRATLFALNTADNRIEIYTVKSGAPYLVLAAEVTVGLEPVAVAPRSDTEVWVVNSVSDSISILTRSSVASNEWRLVRTLLTCDEPRDIVFAQNGLAFVSAARRGPACPVEAASTTPGAGRGVVQVFDPANLGTAVGGVPHATRIIDGDVVRALAADPQRPVVYVGVHFSGNATTIVPEPDVSSGMGLPPPKFGAKYPPGSFPLTGLIVKRTLTASGVRWEDEIHRDWSAKVKLELPDKDVFRINTNTLEVEREYAGVGTVLMNMAVRPGSGAIYVSDLEARNEVRFEPELQGHFVESHLTRISLPMAAKPVIESVHLNPHIDYNTTSGSPTEIDCSIGLPGALAFSNDGLQLFLAGFGSNDVAILKNIANIASAACGSPERQLIDVAAGPSGLAYDDFLRRLYVLSRLEPAITVIHNATANATVLAVRKLPFDPSPPEVTEGRKFLYDTSNSGHGDSACGACHIFGDFDGLAWDLGDQGGDLSFSGPHQFHPMKGPMTTQTLRGMNGAGPMHWRGDRFGATDKDAFVEFNPAFDGLLGGSQLSAADMAAFAEFALTIAYPPNPHRGVDDSLAPEQASGQQVFDTDPSTVGLPCSTPSCHANPLGTSGIVMNDLLPQEFKVAHLRNLYQKVGMFNSTPPQPQVRGFGYLHDGSIATLGDFVTTPVFQLTPTQEAQLEAFLLAFDTGLKPAVGQQLTLTSATATQPDAIARLDLLTTQAALPETCDLVAKAFTSGKERGWVYDAGTFKGDKAGTSASVADLVELALTAPVTFTCVPPGSGMRIGIDRDGDTLPDGDDPNPVGP